MDLREMLKNTMNMQFFSILRRQIYSAWEVRCGQTYEKYAIVCRTVIVSGGRRASGRMHMMQSCPVLITPRPSGAADSNAPRIPPGLGTGGSTRRLARLFAIYVQHHRS